MRAPAFGELCLALLREGHAVRFRAAGLSMAPSIEDGDVITVAPLTTAVRRGDVLLYLSGGRLTAHRVIGRVRGGEPLLRVRGDAPGWEEERVRLDAILAAWRASNARGFSSRREGRWPATRLASPVGYGGEWVGRGEGRLTLRGPRGVLCPAIGPSQGGGRAPASRHLPRKPSGDRT